MLAALNRHEEAVAALFAGDPARPARRQRRQRLGRDVVDGAEPAGKAIEQFRIAAELAPQDGVRLAKLRVRLRVREPAGGGDSDSPPRRRALAERVRRLDAARRSGLAVPALRRSDADRPPGRRSWRPNDAQRRCCSETRCRRSRVRRSRGRVSSGDAAGSEFFDPPSNLAAHAAEDGSCDRSAGDVRAGLPRWPKTLMRSRTARWRC